MLIDIIYSTDLLEYLYVRINLHYTFIFELYFIVFEDNIALYK